MNKKENLTYTRTPREQKSLSPSSSCLKMYLHFFPTIFIACGTLKLKLYVCVEMANEKEEKKNNKTSDRKR